MVVEKKKKYKVDLLRKSLIQSFLAPEHKL